MLETPKVTQEAVDNMVDTVEAQREETLADRRKLAAEKKRLEGNEVEDIGHIALGRGPQG